VIQPREPGHYWVILDPGVVPEVAYCDGDNWWAVGYEWPVEPKAVLNERLELSPIQRSKLVASIDMVRSSGGMGCVAILGWLMTLF
jgi:hypothetical protein